MIKKLISYLILVLFISSCSLSEKTSCDANNFTQPAILLSKSYSQYLYKVGITLPDRFLSGIMLIKQNKEDQSSRMVILTEFGLNLFDFIYQDGKVKLVSCQDYLNKNILIRILKKDLLFIMENNDSLNFKNSDYFFDKENSIVEYQDSDYSYHYNKDNKLESVYRRFSFFKKVRANVFQVENNEILSFEIRHGNQLTLNFQLIEKKI